MRKKCQGLKTPAVGLERYWDTGLPFWGGHVNSIFWGIDDDLVWSSKREAWLALAGTFIPPTSDGNGVGPTTIECDTSKNLNKQYATKDPWLSYNILAETLGLLWLEIEPLHRPAEIKWRMLSGCFVFHMKVSWQPQDESSA
ncbi:hypothetical protein DIRU0_E47950 [Diutina rugosa]